MHTGTLIEDLIAAVERAEQHARESTPSADPEVWYTHLSEAQPDLLGVA
ncbi:MAG TPA: hypothetical protein VEI01_15780 [Terriglobales bacterium]|nr:hypothetical protein [Terriglobales bacterium]